MKRIPLSECLIPYLSKCDRGHRCWRCDIADRYRENLRRNGRESFDSFEYRLFDHTDVLPKTPKGGGLEYVYRPIILKPEAMRRCGIDEKLINQILLATDGAGMFSHNPGSELDGYLVADLYEKRDRALLYTFGRQDFYGVPNEKAIERFRKVALIDLKNAGVMRMR